MVFSRKTIKLFILFIAGMPSVSGNAVASPAADKAAYIGNAAYHIYTTQSWGYVVALDTLVRAHEEDPSVDLQTAAIKVSSTGVIDDRKAQIDFAKNIYDLFDRVSGVKLGGILKDAIDLSEGQRAIGSIYSEHAPDYLTYLARSDKVEQVLSDVYDAALKDPKFAKAINLPFADLFAASIGDPADKILERNPQFRDSSAVQKILDSQGNLKDTLNKIQDTFSADLDNVRKEFEEGLLQIPKREDTLNSSTPSDLILRLERQAADQRASESNEIRNNGIRAGAFIISQFIPDKNRSRQLLLIANASVDMYSNLTKLKAAVATEKFDEEVSSMSEVSLCLTMIQLGIEVYQGMQDKGPSPDEMIFKELQGLSNQMFNFQKQLNVRIDDIDQKLGSISRSMQNSFFQLSQQISLIDVDFTQFAKSAHDTSRKIDVLNANLLDFSKAIAGQSFEQHMQECIDHKTNTGNDLHQDAYDICVSSILQTMKAASQKVYTGHWDDGMRWQDLKDLIRGNEWPDEIGLLKDLAQKQAGYTFSDNGARANPTQWLAASEAYILLAEQNMSLFRKEPIAALEAIRAEGQAIDREIAVEYSSDPKRYIAFLDYLLSLYKESAKAVKSASQSVLQATAAKRGWNGLKYSQADGESYWTKPGGLFGASGASLSPDVTLPIDSVLDKIGQPVASSEYQGYTASTETSDPAIPAPFIVDVLKLQPAIEFYVSLMDHPPIGNYQFKWMQPSYRIASAIHIGVIWGIPFLAVNIFDKKVDGTNRLLVSIASNVADRMIAFSSDAPAHEMTEWGFYPPKDSQQMTAGLLNSFEKSPAAQNYVFNEIEDIDKLHDNALLIVRDAVNQSLTDGVIAESVDKMDGIAKLIRDFVVMTLPDALEDDGTLRRILFGRPISNGCSRSISRVTSAVRAEFTLSDELTKTFCLPGEAQEPSPVDSINLLSSSNVVSIVNDQSEYPNPGLRLSKRSLLLNVDKIADSSATALVQHAVIALARRSAHHNRDVSLQLDRLEVLEQLRSSH